MNVNFEYYEIRYVLICKSNQLTVCYMRILIRSKRGAFFLQVSERIPRCDAHHEYRGIIGFTSDLLIYYLGLLFFICTFCLRFFLHTMSNQPSDIHTFPNTGLLGCRTRHRAGTLPAALSATNSNNTNSTYNNNSFLTTSPSTNDMRLRSSSVFSANSSLTPAWDETIPTINIDSIDGLEQISSENIFHGSNVAINRNTTNNKHPNKSGLLNDIPNISFSAVDDIDKTTQLSISNGSTHTTNPNLTPLTANTHHQPINHIGIPNDIAINFNHSSVLPHSGHAPLQANNSFPQNLRPRSQTYAAPNYLMNQNINGNNVPANLFQQQQLLQQQLHFNQQKINNLQSFQLPRASSFSANPKPHSNSFSHSQQNQFIPILQDNIPENSISITSSHTNASLNYTNTLLFINVPNDPTITNSKTFYSLLKQYGLLISVRIIYCNGNVETTGNHNGNNTAANDLVVITEFNDVESAIRCKMLLDGTELYPGKKCCILFAKILELSSSIQQQSFLNPNPVTTPNVAMKQNPIDLLNYQIDSLNNQSNILYPSASNGNPNSNATIQTPRHRSKSASQLEDSFPFKMTSLADRVSFFNKIYEGFLKKYPNLLDADELDKGEKLLSNALNFPTIKSSSLGPLPPTDNKKKIDNPSLREIRKQLDNNLLTPLQVEQLAISLDEILPELASDYLGNTVVQKFLDIVSPVVREDLIKTVAPYLSQMSAHKNGTWAAQKLINTVANENTNSKYPGSLREMELVSDSLKPYTVHLFNDTYANYVIHGVLKFKYPFSNFIFEALLSSFLEISFNRFGSRAVRSCLESIESNKEIGKEKTALLVNAILTWSWELMADVNGSLLITWFFETCQLIENKHLLLAQVLTDDLNIQKDGEVSLDDKFVKLCTLKLGSLGVLKILNYRNDLSARDLILRKIFGSDIFSDSLEVDEKLECDDNEAILKSILTEGVKLKEKEESSQFFSSSSPSLLPLPSSSHGSNFIHKIISIPTLDVILKKKILCKIKLALSEVISEYGTIPNNSMKRLCEECGIRGFSANRGVNSLSSLGWAGNNRSRSSSTNTNVSIEYDFLLRQQLDELNGSSSMNLIMSNMNTLSLNGGGMNPSMGNK